MITYSDIRMAIVDQLDKTKIEVNSRDLSESFIRPSFFVQLDNVNRSGNESEVHKSMTVQIYFFPTDRFEYAIEVLSMQETLESLFDLKLPVKDRFLNVDELRTYLNDGVLNCTFDLEFNDGRILTPSEGTVVDKITKPPGYYEKHPIEPMETLDIEKVKE